MIGILDSLSGVWKPITGTHRVISSCNLSSLIYKGLESTLFLSLPLTKLPHPNTIYRYIGPGAGGGVLASEHVLSRARGATYTFSVSRAGDVQNFYSWDRGQRGDGYSERGRVQRVW